MRMAISVARPNLVSLGTCFGKFSKSGKFKLHITALDYLAQYAKYKVSKFILQGIAGLRQLLSELRPTRRPPAVGALTLFPLRSG